MEILKELVFLMDEFSKTILFIILIVVSLVAVLFVVPQPVFEGDYCSVCEWNWAYMQLLDYKDPGYGHEGALEEIWDEANYGKQLDLDWYEDYRIKYSLEKDVHSFTLINYSNPRPSSPNIKFMDEGNITEIVYSHDVGYPRLVYVNPVINGTEYYWHIWEIGHSLPDDWQDGDPFPINYSHHYYVYKQKHNAWHWKYKDAIIVDGTENPEHKYNILEEWNNYYARYQDYLNNGGVDLGDDYWM